MKEIIFLNKSSTRFITFFGLGVDRGFPDFIGVVCTVFGLGITGRGNTFDVLFGVVDGATRFVIAGETLGFCGGCLTPALVLAEDVVFILPARCR